MEIEDERAGSDAPNTNSLRVSAFAEKILAGALGIEQAKRAVIVSFLEISTKDCTIPAWYLQKYVQPVILSRAIRELVLEGLVEQHNTPQEGDLKLASKGALRLWFWNRDESPNLQTMARPRNADLLSPDGPEMRIISFISMRDRCG